MSLLNNFTAENLEALLNKTIALLAAEFSGKPNVANINGVTFEKIVFEKMLIAANGIIAPELIKQTGAQTFPDIIINNKYGIEVKMTLGDKWVSTGNSIMEGTRVDGLEEIYILFGRFGTNFEVRHRKYQDCLNDIVVTHSPRYKIDMELAAGNSIFDKMGVSYDNLRNNKFPVSKLKEYYRSQLKKGEELWWIDQSEDAAVKPVLGLYKNLGQVEKDRFIIESMILFPEIFGSSITKFERVATYMVAHYNVIHPSLRDIFTAGGKIELIIEGERIKVPQIMCQLSIYAPKIAAQLNSTPKEKLVSYWNKNINACNIETWKQLLASHCPLALKVYNSNS